MPELNADAKAMVDKYVSDRLAKGDKAGDINRDLQAHWAQIDADAAASAEAAKPEVMPQYAPLPSGHVTGSGVSAQEAAASAAHFAGPLTQGAVREMLRQGKTAREIAEMARQHGVARA